MTEPNRLLDLDGLVAAPQLTAKPDTVSDFYSVAYGPNLRVYAAADKAAARAYYAALPDFVGWYDDGGGNFSIALSSSYGGSPVSTTEQLPGFIEAPSAKTYVLVINAKYPFTIDEMTICTAGGTCTARLQIDGVDVGGLNAVAVTSSEQTIASTSAKSVAAGQDVTLILSAITSAVDLRFNLKLTR